jgi:hypothetical protein
MSTHSDVFTEVINDLLKELSPLPHSSQTILGLLTNNLDSPVLAKIQHLSLSQLNVNQMATLLPALAQMTSLISLALTYCDASPDHFKFIFTECSALSKLQSLDLRGVRQLMSEDFQLLSQSTTITNLTSLNLTGCENIFSSRATTSPQSGPGFAGFGSFGDNPGSGGLAALLSSPVVKNLTHLHLRVFHIKGPDLLPYDTIAQSPFLSNLVSLDLAGHSPDKVKFVTAFAASTTLTNLTHLSLPQAQLRDDLVAQLLSPPSLLAKKLRSINLGDANITVRSLQVLLDASPHLTELVLTTRSWDLRSAGVQFIATNMPNLTKLDLSFCKIADDGCAALAASTTLTNLRELNLNANRIGTESLIALVNSPAMANLTELNLKRTHEGHQVLTAIAQSAAMSKLQRLVFGSNQVGDEGAIALAESTTLTNLTSLDLTTNDIGPEGVKALCTSPVVSKLTSLNLSFNQRISTAIAPALAAPSSTLYNVVDLNLSNCSLTDAGMSQLLATPNLAQLNSLVVCSTTTAASNSTRAVYRARFEGPI